MVDGGGRWLNLMAYMLGSKMVISKSTAMIISYSRISRKTFTERKIGSEWMSESRTKDTRRRAEPSRGSARRRAQPSRRSARRRAEPSCGCTRPASSTIAPVSSPASWTAVWLCSPSSSAITRVGSPGELDLIPVDEKWNIPKRDRLGPEGEGWATNLERLYKESMSRRKGPREFRLRELLLA